MSYRSLLFIAAAGCSLVGCATQADRSHRDSLGAVAADEQRFAAAVDADVATLQNLLADDLVYCHSGGDCEGKASFIESLRSGALDYEFIRPEKPTVTALGDAVILNGAAIARFSRNGSPMREAKLGYTDVFVWRDGRWQLVAWRSIGLPNP